MSTYPAMTIQPAGGRHDHPVDIEACLALVNTEELTDGVPEERLASAADGVTWLAEHGLGHRDQLAEQARREGDRWLERVHRVRAAIRATWDAIVAGGTPDARALAVLNEVLRSQPRLELRLEAGALEVGHRHLDDDPTGEALARLVEPLVEAIATGSTGRFRVCANDGCRWAFEDTSRAGRRRWCDMTTCGNRAKVRRYRSRHRDTAADGGEPRAEQA
jgi:predicted RNA-binding Zn ribbon-like protein